MPGAGSTFHIFLPASKESVVHQNSITKSTHTGQGIFIVMDDEEVMRDTISCILNSFGYSVIGAENGQVAIKMLSDAVASNRNVAAMILDLTIPGGQGGKDIIQKIRKISSDLPVFVTSGYAEDPVMAKPEEYSFTASICKPFRKSELADMLNRYISH
jgi:CheY-like chemotaxis protein